jgi:hypothetical protein
MMDLPFTTEEFLDVFERYNEGVWPAQLVVYPVGAAAVVLMARGTRRTDQLAAAMLGAMWIWVGVAYHFVYFSEINPSARVFALLFVAQGLVLLIGGGLFRQLGFGEPLRPSALVGVALICFSAVVYPSWGALVGHVYPRAPIFGISPCPLTIFTFGALLMARTRVPLGFIAVPFLWSLVGGSAGVLLGVPQDTALPLSGMLSAVLILVRNRGLGRRFPRSKERAESSPT